jgi:hypothetical protein
MDQRERGLEARVQQITIVGRKLAHQDHALVDNGPGRHRDRVIFQDLLRPDRNHAIRDDLADNVEAPLEIVFAGEVRRASDEDLLHDRLDRLDAFA